VGADVGAARAAAYEGVARIRLKGSHHRTDIAATLPEPRLPAAHVVEAAESAPTV
jgi:phosphoribosylamine--glycine ligase